MKRNNITAQAMPLVSKKIKRYCISNKRWKSICIRENKYVL